MEQRKVIHSYKDLIVWQKTIELAEAVYLLTSTFPSEEKFGLSSQMKRCSVSIPSNIAERRFRGTRKDFLQLLRIAYGSGAELETQIELTKRLKFSSAEGVISVEVLLDEVMRMLNVIIRKLSKASPAKETN
jgi:four helix bundle protein